MLSICHLWLCIVYICCAWVQCTILCQILSQTDFIYSFIICILRPLCIIMGIFIHIPGSILNPFFLLSTQIPITLSAFFFLSFCNIIKMSIYWLFIQFCYIFIFFHRIADPSQRENLGIIVQYKVKVKLCIGSPILGGYVSSCFRSALDIYIHKYT